MTKLKITARLPIIFLFSCSLYYIGYNISIIILLSVINLPSLLTEMKVLFIVYTSCTCVLAWNVVGLDNLNQSIYHARYFNLLASSMNFRYNKNLIPSWKFDEFLIHFGNDLFSLINNPNLNLKMSLYGIELDIK